MSNDRFKFRVWDKKDKKYLDPDYYERFYMHPDGVVDVVMTVEHTLYDEYQVIPAQQLIVEQCTGLRDRNNKLIYEGDVVMCELPGSFRSVEAVVKWFAPGNDRVEWRCEYLNHFEPNRTSKVISGYTGRELWGKNCTVIGNIHEMEVCQ